VTLNTTQSTTGLAVDNLRLNVPTVVAIQVNDGAIQRSMVNSVNIEFASKVTLPADAAYAFSLIGPSGPVSVNVDTTGSPSGQTIARLTFSGPGTLGGSLNDGNYTLTVLGQQITLGDQAFDADNNGVPGGSLAFSFHRLFGDADGNRNVSAADFNAFRLAYGQVGPSLFDVDGDGVVSAADFNQFRMRYGMMLMP